MDTIDNRLRAGLLKNKAFGIEKDSLEYKDELYFDIKGRIGLRVIVPGEINDDDCRLAWRHERKWIKCTDFARTQVPVGRAVIGIYNRIYVDENDNRILDGEIWQNSVNFIGSSCIATVIGARTFSRWHTVDPKLLVEIETNPGEIAMFSTSATNLEIRYRGLSIAGKRGGAGNAYLFKDGNHIEVSKDNVSNMAGLFAYDSDIKVPFDEKVRIATRDKGEVYVNTVDELTKILGVSPAIILGSKPTVKDNDMAGWSIKVDAGWGIHVDRMRT